MNPPSAAPRALIAEDEALLAADLRAGLARAWPELEIVASVGHGAAAVEQTLALVPDIVFLDIRMPGMSGLDAARALVEDAPVGMRLPLIVFVTAYDQYAVEAFERAAFDYLLKPVRADRLAQTCMRLRAALGSRGTASAEPGEPHGATDAASADTAADAIPADQRAVGLGTADALLAQLRQLLQSPALAGSPAPRLATIQASVGTVIHMVPVDEVLYLEAADKYVRVVTAAREYLIRTSLRELLPQLDPTRFWQIHRGTVVRQDAIATAVRDESGKVHLSLRGSTDRLVASRLYAHLFKAL